MLRIELDLIGLDLEKYVDFILIGMNLFIDYVKMAVFVTCSNYEDIRFAHNIDMENFYFFIRISYLLFRLL